MNEEEKNKKEDSGILESISEVVIETTSCIGDGICAVGEGIGSIFSEILSV